MIIFKFFKQHILFLVCLISLLSSCKDPCNEKETKVVPLTDSDKATIPYHGFDTLRFLHNDTDTLEFVGQGIDTILRTVPVTVESCPLEFADLEEHMIRFDNISSKKADPIRLRLASRSLGTADLSIEYKQRYGTYTSFIGPPYNLSSIIINSITYNDIDFIMVESSGTGKIYYNTSHGILKIEAPGDVLTILP